MKILFISTVGSTMFFFEKLITGMTAAGHTIDIAANELVKPLPDFYRNYEGKIFHISCTRSPLSLSTVRAVKEIRRIVMQNDYDIVHCHTPVAGACARLACRKLRKKGLRVIYTAHGFHFYQGAPLKNWLIYYPIEKFCSRFTDVLITINHEDYAFTKKRLKASTAAYIPGVGVDIERFRDCNIDREGMRREIGIPQDAFTLISVGELNRNKNHQIVIRALARLKDPDIHYMIAGKGALKDELSALSCELGIEKQVHLLGFREDTPKLYKAADVEVFPSIREGLGLAAVEGMAAGLPPICFDNRGTREYMGAYSETGFTGMCRSETEFADAIRVLKNDAQLRENLSRIGSEVCLNFSDENVRRRMEEIYGVEIEHF